ncbi:MAG: hypothetical protein RIQ93_2125 [Verrucomicrobiota bacterium]|jgi:hypothetical protein
MLIAVAGLPGVLFLRGADPAVSAPPARADTEKIRVAIVDNAAYPPVHRAGYNGVAELALPGGTNVFVPAVSGLNLEHFFSGDQASFAWHLFEPRQAPMTLTRHSPTRVELQQERTEHWPLRSRMLFEVAGDAIDLTYFGRPLANAWSKHGYIGIFFASYIQAPTDMSIQFIGRSRAGAGETRARWIKHLPPGHGVAANHRPVGSNWDPPMDEGFNVKLAKGISDLEYAYPFYFGRSGENVLVFMFEKPRANREVRFAQSPSGGGAGNPAWDFIFFERDFAVNREFSFRMRTVYRKFTSVEDIVLLYEQWSGDKVVRPRN